MTKKAKPNPMHEALQEMGDDMLRLGVIDGATYAKITLRHVPSQINDEELTPGEIRALREELHLSQGALGHYIHVSTGYVSQIERGIRRPTGPALVLLNVIRRKGLEAIL